LIAVGFPSLLNTPPGNFISQPLPAKILMNFETIQESEWQNLTIKLRLAEANGTHPHKSIYTGVFHNNANGSIFRSKGNRLIGIHLKARGEIIVKFCNQFGEGGAI
jgi:hypothetical protein